MAHLGVGSALHHLWMGNDLREHRSHFHRQTWRIILVGLLHPCFLWLRRAHPRSDTRKLKHNFLFLYDLLYRLFRFPEAQHSLAMVLTISSTKIIT